MSPDCATENLIAKSSGLALPAVSWTADVIGIVAAVDQSGHGAGMTAPPVVVKVLGIDS